MFDFYSSTIATHVIGLAAAYDHDLFLTVACRLVSTYLYQKDYTSKGNNTVPTDPKKLQKYIKDGVESGKIPRHRLPKGYTFPKDLDDDDENEDDDDDDDEDEDDEEEDRKSRKKRKGKKSKAKKSKSKSKSKKKKKKANKLSKLKGDFGGLDLDAFDANKRFGKDFASKMSKSAKSKTTKKGNKQTKSKTAKKKAKKSKTKN